MKRIICIIAVIALIASFALIPASAASPNDARESVAVVLTCLDLGEDGWIPIATGSCFFVGAKGKDPTNMVTNYHVISDYVDYGAGELIDFSAGGRSYSGRTQIRIYFNSDDYVEAFPVEYDTKKDIAVLKLEAPTSERKPIALLPVEDSMVGESIYAIGYPGISDNDYKKATNTWQVSDSTVTNGTISRLITVSGVGVNVVQTDCAINHGNSGGPIVNSNGEAIAIASASVSEMYPTDLTATTVYYGINVSDVIPILERNSVPYFKGGSFNYLILIIIVAAVLVIAGVVVLIIVLTSSKKKAAQQQAAQQQAAQQQAQAARAAQAAKAAQAAQAAKAAQASASKNEKYPYLRSYAVQHNGKRIVIRDAQIFIGRNVNVCAVVFKEGTPGVSGRHCSLSYNKATGDFILTDLNSSYGTYLSDGTKLNPGVPYHLRSGDRFYLGDKENMMGVELE